GDNDGVPPKKRNRMGVGQRVPLEVADDLRALLRISTDRLTDIEGVEKAVGRAGMVDRREVAGNVSRELYRRIVEIVGGQIGCRGKAAGFERGLPVLGA